MLAIGGRSRQPQGCGGPLSVVVVRLCRQGRGIHFSSCEPGPPLSLVVLGRALLVSTKVPQALQLGAKQTSTQESKQAIEPWTDFYLHQKALVRGSSAHGFWFWVGVG